MDLRLRRGCRTRENALLFLTQKAMERRTLWGRLRPQQARNRGQNFLSRCINLELVTIQRVHHTGLCQLFKLGTIPGTNFIVKTALIQDIGGWDEHAITEDTAISFEILTRGADCAGTPSRSLSARARGPESVHEAA